MGYAIENGYFVFTMMPSLHCKLNCPHCYLSKEERRSTEILSVEDIKLACQKVDKYYQAKEVRDKSIQCYWYGGEPTDMGQDYFISVAEVIGEVFAETKGYELRHTILSAMVTVDPSWYPIFEKYCKGIVQTSFDGLMRGLKYVKRWEEKVLELNDFGLKVSTITVVNNEIIANGPEKTLDYISDLGIHETSWLPFMLNDQNSSGAYESFAPNMREYSKFMIGLGEHWYKRKRAGLHVPYIGQMEFILSQANTPGMANIAVQTLFLMPNGDFVLPDYRDGHKEYMRIFGNILDQSFEDILTGDERRAYLRRQVTKNANLECLSCPHTDKCIMEFWKPNREDDECFGARRFVEWALKKDGEENLADKNAILY
jgi:sulfatase maturation enzyme AslB (radical SAM superfamily)